MATIRDFFDLDLHGFAVTDTWSIKGPTGMPVLDIVARPIWNFEANAKYWSLFFCEKFDLVKAIDILLEQPMFTNCWVSLSGDDISMEVGQGEYHQRFKTTELCFTKRVHFYVDASLEASEVNSAREYALSKGYFLSVRDQEYAKIRSSAMQPLAFISHDSRDKASFVRDLVHALTMKGCPVWYDEHTLSVGDNLREKIESGLKTIPRCLLILSPNYIANHGWAKAEFDSVHMREILEGQDVILPIWLNVGVKEVYEFSPRLANKVALSSERGVEEVANTLSSVLKKRPPQKVGGE